MRQYKDSNYYITKTGDVYSNHSGQMKKIKLSLRRGYPSFVFYYKTIRKYKTIHRLVAELYIPNLNNYPEVNHINGIKNDNRVENLEWVTKSMNEKHKYDFLGHTGVRGEKHSNSKLTEEQVKYIKDNYISRHKEFGGRALGRKFNVNYATISLIINNKLWNHI